MGIKHQGNSVAFYHSRRVGDRVISEYGGSGVLAEMMAFDARVKAEELAEQRRQRDAERQRVRAREAATAEAARAITEAVRLILGRAGYHQHKRGSWRKRRGEGSNMAGVDAAVIERARKGDRSILPGVT